MAQFSKTTACHCTDWPVCDPCKSANHETSHKGCLGCHGCGCKISAAAAHAEHKKN